MDETLEPKPEEFDDVEDLGVEDQAEAPLEVNGDPIVEGIDEPMEPKPE